LTQHPQICGSTLKETEYFSRLVYPDAHLEPISTYERYFRHCRDERYVLEASPNYWYGGPRLFEATEALLGRPRYVVSLRNPVDRFWSDFTYMKSKLLLDKDMSAQTFLDRCLELRKTGGDLKEEGRRFRTLSTGFYIDYLPEWISAVGSRSKIVFFEHLTTDPAAVVSELLSWLDLDAEPAGGFDFSERNPTINHRSAKLQQIANSYGNRARERLKRYPRSKELVSDIYYRINSAGARSELLDTEIRLQLDDLYRDANKQLRDELTINGYDRLPTWLADA
jgi:hypothetical protein